MICLYDIPIKSCYLLIMFVLNASPTCKVSQFHNLNLLDRL